MRTHAVLSILVVLSAGGAHAAVCDSWQQLSPLPFAADLNAVTAGDRGVLAVGTGGTILVSADGDRWQELASPTTSELVAVAWGDDRAVAVGEDGSVVVSPDGRSWRLVDSGSGARLAAVAFGDGHWVAVGEGGTAVASDDGEHWSVVDTGTSDDLVAVAWSGTRFIAAGGESTVLGSFEGRYWDAPALMELPRIEPVDLASDGQRLVLTGRYRSMVSLDHGRHWAEIFDLMYRLGLRVEWDGERFVAGLGGGWALVSDSALSWDPLDVWQPLDAEVHDIAARDGTIVEVGADGFISRYLPDEQRWTVVAGRSSVLLNKVATRAGTTVVSGGEGWPANAMVLTSRDGVHFTTTYAHGYERLVDVVASDSGFVVVGGYTELFCVAMILFSEDGESWDWAELEPGSAPGGCNFESLAARGDLVVAAGDGLAATSEDGGRSWFIRAISNQQTYVVGASDQLFVIVDTAGDVFTSPDGAAWQAHRGRLPSLHLNAIAWGAGQFVAVGNGGAVFSSSDGAVWHQVAVDTSEDLLDLSWDGEEFLVVGASGLLLTFDGSSWSRHALPFVTPLRGVEAGDQGTVVVGGRGLIARSTCALTAAGPVADFSWMDSAVVAGRPLQLYDLSLGEVATWQWRFGDGSGSDQPSPRHVFAATGSYPVELSVAGAGGSSSRQRQVEVRPLPAEAFRHQLFLPGLGHLPGLKGTEWRSDVELCNAGSEPAAAELALLRRDADNHDPETVATTIPGPGCVRFVDVLDQVFHSTGAAALRIASVRPLLATSRTYNRTPAGSYGSFKTAAGADDAVRAGGSWALLQLAQSADGARGFRTNVDLLNLSDHQLELTLELREPGGQSLGQRSVTLAAFGYTQLAQPLLAIAPAGLEAAFLLVTTDDPDGRVLARASVVDNLSGDGISVPALRWR